MIKYITSVLSCFILTGCYTTIEKTITIRETKYIPITVSGEYLKSVEKPSLFTREEYLKMSEDQRRKALVEAIVDRDLVIDQFNIRLKAINDESNKLKDIVESKKTEPIVTQSSRVINGKN